MLTERDAGTERQRQRRRRRPVKPETDIKHQGIFRLHSADQVIISESYSAVIFVGF